MLVHVEVPKSSVFPTELYYQMHFHSQDNTKILLRYLSSKSLLVTVVFISVIQIIIHLKHSIGYEPSI